MPSNATEINVLHELENWGIKWQAGSDSKWVQVRCAFHDDQEPSCGVNTESAYFKCNAAGCGKSGHLAVFFAQTARNTGAKTTEQEVYAELSRRYNLDADTKYITLERVEQFHSRVWDSGPLLQALRDRTITDADIRKYRLGFDGQRITIPVFNAAGQCVNLRKYLPGAGAKKMLSVKGYSRLRLYPIEQLKYDTIVVTGGELKAIAGARALNGQGIGCVTATGGEGAWDKGFGPLFDGKKVIICLDIDDGGREAVQKVGSALIRHASVVNDLLLPLDIGEYPHGDINDYLKSQGDTAFVNAVMNAPMWKPVTLYGEQFDKSEVPTVCELSEAVSAKFTGKRIQTTATISAMGVAQYILPSRVTVTCDRKQAFCHCCPVMCAADDTKYEIQDEHHTLIRMVNAPKIQKREALKESIGIPSLCKSCEFRDAECYSAEDVRISQQLDINSRKVERTMQQAIIVKPSNLDLIANETYILTGRLHANPNNQQATLVISDASLTEDSLSAYQAENLESLEVFKPDEWTVESIQDRLDKIYADLTANVTRVYMRDDVHLMVDLVYHSCLLIPFDERVEKGWADCLVIGDSSQGKSTIINELGKHYQVGTKVDCKNSTTAGLHGGLQQIGSKWYVTWGIIPQYDKRLVVLEEIKGAPVEVLNKLTDMRSSGRAEIHKIEKRATNARTRLIMTANPRSDMPLRSYNYGVQAVKELMGSLEDVRRFDAVIALSADDISARDLNHFSTHRPRIKQVYTADVCKALILWGWSRTESQIVFEPEATAEVFQAATRLAERYVEDIPIVDRGSQRFKVARLAAALAVRTFSHADGDYSTVVVRKCHVEYLEKYLQKIYDADALGYYSFSNSKKKYSDLKEAEEIKLELSMMTCSEDFIRLILDADNFEVSDIQDWANIPREVALDMVSKLVRRNAMAKKERYYRKSPAFVALLKELLDNVKDKNVTTPGNDQY
jgi:hypothetical protein